MFILNTVYQPILLCCKIDSDDTQTLISAKDQDGLWRASETAQNIFIECEKIFRSFTSEFHLVSELIKEMQTKSIIISNYDLLCYSNEPKVNKELSVSLLESMLELFVKVLMCSFASDVKEKHKVKNKKTKARSLRTEIKKSSSSKDFNHYILSNIQCNLWPETLKVGHETAMFIVTHLKLHYLRLKL